MDLRNTLILQVTLNRKGSQKDFIDAVQNGDLDKMSSLLTKMGDNCNIPYAFTCYSLDNQTLAKVALQHSTKSHIITEKTEYVHIGVYALCIASRTGNVALVQTLLAQPLIDPSACGNFPIRLACQYGHSEVLKALLTHNKVNALNQYAFDIPNISYRIVSRQKLTAISAFNLACINNHVNIATILLQNKRIRLTKDFLDTLTDNQKEILQKSLAVIKSFELYKLLMPETLEGTGPLAMLPTDIIKLISSCSASLYQKDATLLHQCMQKPEPTPLPVQELLEFGMGRDAGRSRCKGSAPGGLRLQDLHNNITNHNNVMPISYTTRYNKLLSMPKCLQKRLEERLSVRELCFKQQDEVKTSLGEPGRSSRRKELS